MHNLNLMNRLQPISLPAVAENIVQAELDILYHPGLPDQVPIVHCSYIWMQRK